MINNAENEWVVNEDFNGLRIDYWIKKKFSNLSYPSICKIIRKGQLRVNKKRVKNTFVVTTGDRIRIYKTIDQKKKKNLKINSKFANIIKDWVFFKDHELIALNKPSGIPVQGGSNVKLNIDLLLDYLRYESESRPRLIHRIDKKTSGLLLIARNLKCAKFLGNVFRERKIKKKYLLIVKGLIKEKSGEIKLPIITNKKENSAVTQYRLLGIFNQNSLILASPLTGRKHQIRKHFSIIGHPIIGDDKFGTKDSNNFFLHSYYAEFKNEKEKVIQLFAPIPDYFKDIIYKINININNIEDKIKQNIL